VGRIGGKASSRLAGIGHEVPPREEGLRERSGASQGWRLPTAPWVSTSNGWAYGRLGDVGSASGHMTRGGGKRFGDESCRSVSTGHLAAGLAQPGGVVIHA